MFPEELSFSAVRGLANVVVSQVTSILFGEVLLPDVPQFLPSLRLEGGEVLSDGEGGHEVHGFLVIQGFPYQWIPNSLDEIPRQTTVSAVLLLDFVRERDTEGVRLPVMVKDHGLANLLFHSLVEVIQRRLLLWFKNVSAAVQDVD